MVFLISILNFLQILLVMKPYKNTQLNTISFLCKASIANKSIQLLAFGNHILTFSKQSRLFIFLLILITSIFHFTGNVVSLLRGITIIRDMHKLK